MYNPYVFLYFEPYLNILTKVDPQEYTLESDEWKTSNWILDNECFTGMYELADGRVIGISLYTTITGDIVAAFSILL